MLIKPIKTKIMHPPQEDIFGLLSTVPTLSEYNVLCVTSKIVAIHQGRTVLKQGVNKDELIKSEAQYYIDRNFVPGEHAILTIINGSLMASAGIDGSNAGEYYVLWPIDIEKMAIEIRAYFAQRDGLSNLGVIITDSHSSPLRRGSIGFALASAGLEALKNYVGRPDLFGEELKVSVVNVVDSLASAAVLVMGEGDEQTPVAVISELSELNFMAQADMKDVIVPLTEDIYFPLLKRFTEND